MPDLGRIGSVPASPSGDGTSRRPVVTTAAQLGLPDDPASARPKDVPATHVRAKLDRELRALLARAAGTRAGTDPEDLHQMRVAVRRMRSVLKLGGHLLGPAAENVRAELGWLGRALGEVRDLDVLIGHLRETVADLEARDRAAARRLVSLFVTERAKAKRRLSRSLSSPRYATLLRSVAQLARLPEREPDLAPPAGRPVAPTDLVAALRKPYRKLRKAVAALPADPADDELHALRIRGKRLRYAAELAKPVAAKKQARRIEQVIVASRRLQDVLGEHQDAVVAADRMRGLACPPAGEASADRSSVDGAICFVAGRIAERERARRARARTRWQPAVRKIDKAARELV